MIASEAGWDSFTLFLLTCRWLEEKHLASDVVDDLTRRATAAEQPTSAVSSM